MPNTEGKRSGEDPDDFDCAVDFDKYHLEKLKDTLDKFKVGPHVQVTGYLRDFAHVRRMH